MMITRFNSLVRLAFSSSFLYEVSFIVCPILISLTSTLVGFVLLYECFPVPIELSFKDAMGLDDLEHNMHDVIIVNDEYEPYGTTRDDVFIAMSTIKWLDTTGYIYTQNIFSDSASEVLLTDKTLSILKSVPSSLQKQEESLDVRI